jgi:hypothetical protein
VTICELDTNRKCAARDEAARKGTARKCAARDEAARKGTDRKNIAKVFSKKYSSARFLMKGRSKGQGNFQTLFQRPRARALRYY